MQSRLVISGRSRWRAQHLREAGPKNTGRRKIVLQNVILTLATTKRSTNHDVSFWVCTLRDVKSGKEIQFGGYFEGPLSRQAVMNCALIESVQKLKKPVNITVCTSQGHGTRYF